MISMLQDGVGEREVYSLTIIIAVRERYCKKKRYIVNNCKNGRAESLAGTMQIRK